MPSRSFLVPTGTAYPAMVFIDGTNLFHRLEAAKLTLAQDGLHRLAQSCIARFAGGGPVDLVRTYFYTSEPHLAKAKCNHTMGFENYVRMVLGEAIPTGDGNFKEKGVDAMLVADLIYHAATGNLSRAVLVSVDTDFAHAIRRVEDFGCRTMVVGLGVLPPERLRDAADRFIALSERELGDEAIVIEHR